MFLRDYLNAIFISKSQIEENQGSSILSSIEKDDNKGSKVWNHFDKFVDDRGVLCRAPNFDP